MASRKRNLACRKLHFNSNTLGTYLRGDACLLNLLKHEADGEYDKIYYVDRVLSDQQQVLEVVGRYEPQKLQIFLDLKTMMAKIRSANRNLTEALR